MITRKQIVHHIINMEKTQPAYAASALDWYCKALPDLEIRAAYDYAKAKQKGKK